MSEPEKIPQTFRPQPHHIYVIYMQDDFKNKRYWLFKGFSVD